MTAMRCLSHRAVGIVIGASALLNAAGCANTSGPSEHPLQDVIVKSDTRERLSRTALVSEMTAATVVYLGEKHDNSQHQRLQRWVVEALVRAGHRPAIGLEAVSLTDSALLMEYAQSLSDESASDKQQQRLRAALGWDAAHSENWRRYGPLLQLARQHRLDVFGIDLPVALRRRITRRGIDGLSATERSLVPTLGHADPAYRALMLDRLKRAHCGYGSDGYLHRLFDNWRARNETMADAITSVAKTADGSPVVVIVGAGHLKNGLGVIERLAKKLPDARQLNLAFREVDPVHHEIAAYLHSARSTNRELAPEHAYLWFTPREGRSLHAICAQYQEAMKKR